MIKRWLLHVFSLWISRIRVEFRSGSALQVHIEESRNIAFRHCNLSAPVEMKYAHGMEQIHHQRNLQKRTIAEPEMIRATNHNPDPTIVGQSIIDGSEVCVYRRRFCQRLMAVVAQQKHEGLPHAVLDCAAER